MRIMHTQDASVKKMQKTEVVGIGAQGGDRMGREG